MINKTHEAVMVEEVLTYLVIDKNGIYIDCTFGAGGHSQEILKELQDFEGEQTDIKGYYFADTNLITLQMRPSMTLNSILLNIKTSPEAI